jgi:RNA polymerase sigma factor (sigma-70 family)
MPADRTELDRLTKLYRRFSPAIHRRAVAMLQDPEEARDVMQDTFEAYVRREDFLRGEASPFTVLFQIATFKAVDRLRRRARWSGTLGPIDVPAKEDSAPQTAWAPSTEGGLARVEALQDLALLTQGESEPTLTAAFLYFVEGHTLEEIAQVLSVSRKTLSKILDEFSERARSRSARLNSGGAS